MNHFFCRILLLFATSTFVVMAEMRLEYVASNKETMENLLYIFFKVIPSIINDNEINFNIVDINNKFNDIEKDARTMNINDDIYLKPLMDRLNEVISNNCEERSKILTLEEFYILKLTAKDVDLTNNFTLLQIVSRLENNLLNIDHCSANINKNIAFYEKLMQQVVIKNLQSKNHILIEMINSDLEYTMLILEIVINDMQDTKIEKCNVTKKLSEEGKSFKKFLENCKTLYSEPNSLKIPSIVYFSLAGILASLGLLSTSFALKK
ncbi:uncharacterized protein LOC122503984 isoform X2 [Leptopilina heterotoma]|uniref:uncharacterized protein LOC122503984 isoform X2 n=1 Tax=Leptopilina heterotoma TaxID=63436 RepID=UPI001CA8BA33|nr:uncharacterized protein LOC122503984 isoform X2 [Leptopilina heterotoma]